MSDLSERMRACGDPDIDVYVLEESGPELLRQGADRIEALEAALMEAQRAFAVYEERGDLIAEKTARIAELNATLNKCNCPFCTPFGCRCCSEVKRPGFVGRQATD